LEKLKMTTAKVFLNGKSQAVRLPKEFRVKGDTVFVNRVGNTIVLLPKDDPWAGMLDALGKFTDDFMRDREQPDPEERKPW
jgi:antitoxin VapB